MKASKKKVRPVTLMVAMIAMIWIGVTVGNAAAATHQKFLAARRAP